LRILLVEDDADIADAMKQMLELEGYEVDRASHGAEALSMLRDSGASADLILLDLWMPVMDGFAFRKAQLSDSELAAIPVVVVTADSHAGGASRPIDAELILRKPVNPDRLLDVVKSFAA
jgi:CheY-like chemotaxis protein